MHCMTRICAAFLAALTAMPSALAQDIRPPTDLETARVLPRNIRNPRFKTLFTNIDGRYDSRGVAEPLAAKLNKTVTFSDVINARETEYERNEIRGLLANAGLNETDSPGFTTGDISVGATVLAPVLAWGFTDWWTSAVAVPIYFISIKAASGFVASPESQKFITEVEKSGPDKANEAVEKLNNAINDKLARLQYQPLENKNFTALSDIRLVNKFRVLQATTGSFDHTLSLKAETTLPTGQVQSPDDLLAIPVGDGQWDIGAGIAFDETLAIRSDMSREDMTGLTFNADLRWNVHAGYVAQLPATAAVRLPTSANDSTSADKENVWRDFGDIIQAGTSLTLDLMGTGFTLGAGYMYQYMTRTTVSNGSYAEFRYRLLEEQFPERDLHSGILMAGFSTLDYFRAKKFPIPFQANITYTAPLAGRQSTTNSMFQAELVMFF
jgi:hypothetical protein